jgi:hypothetical protein
MNRSKNESTEVDQQLLIKMTKIEVTKMKSDCFKYLRVSLLGMTVLSLVTLSSVLFISSAYADSYYDYRNGQKYLCTSEGRDVEDWSCVESVLSYTKIEKDSRCPGYIPSDPGYNRDACLKKIIINCKDRNSGRTKQEYDTQFSHCVAPAGFESCD